MDSIDTKRSSSGALSTVTQARDDASPYSGMDLGAFLSKVVDLKDRRRQPEAPVRSYAPQPEIDRSTYAPTLGAQQSSPAYAEQQKAMNPVKRMRRVQRRSSIPVFGLEGNGLTYDDVEETMLPDGSWSKDALHGTLAGNERAAMNGPMDITKLVGMNFSGLGGGTWGLDANDPRSKGKG